MSMYIIDDHPLVRSAIAMLLRRMRSSTKVIELDKFSELQAAIIKNGEPTLFVLDLLLPGVKGTSAVTEVKKMYPEVPLAVLSSMPAGEAEETCIEAGADIISKNRHLATKSAKRSKACLRLRLATKKPFH